LKTFTFRLNDPILIKQLQKEVNISDVIRSAIKMYYTRNTAEKGCNTQNVIHVLQNKLEHIKSHKDLQLYFTSSFDDTFS
jgi:hypothetical protein